MFYTTRAQVILGTGALLYHNSSDLSYSMRPMLGVSVDTSQGGKSMTKFVVTTGGTVWDMTCKGSVMVVSIVSPDVDQDMHLDPLWCPYLWRVHSIEGRWRSTITCHIEWKQVCLDYLTKWVEAFPTPDQQATTVAELIIEHIVCQHGVSEE